MIVITNRFTNIIIVSGETYNGCFDKFKNLSGADLRGANLIDADLRGADLKRAYLRGANLRSANLVDADLSFADLKRANLRGADLSFAHLSFADLRGADLRGANFRDTYLSGADLRGADLSGANLRGAYLRGANLSGADLSGADLSGAIINDTTKLPDFKITPLQDAFIAYKKTSKGVITIQIPANAKRTNCIGSRKCRAEFVKVLDGEGLGGHSPTQTGYQKLTYNKGDIVTADTYNDDIREECTGGIHFFMTYEEAEAY